MAGSAAYDGEFTTDDDASDCFFGERDVLRDGELLKWRGDIEHVVGNTRHFRLGNFSRAEVESAVHLAGVAGNYFSIKFFGEAYRELRFSTRGRSDDSYYGEIHLFTSLGDTICDPVSEFSNRVRFLIAGTVVADTHGAICLFLLAHNDGERNLVFLCAANALAERL